MKCMVDKKPRWIEEIKPIILNSESFNSIYQFYVLHTPCEELSARSKPIEKYGWTDPWKKPNKLNKKLERASSSEKLIYYADSYDNMTEALERSNMLIEEDFLNDISVERICVYNNKKNMFMSTFYHLRNSLAHGRYNIVEANGDKVYIMEDISTRNKGAKAGVSARMVIFESTLLKWIELIEKGENVLDS